MEQAFLVYDNFYNDPYGVREHAMTCEYKIKGNYPGTRTGPLEDQEQFIYLKGFFEDLLHKKITYWPKDVANTSYQLTLEGDETWIHKDGTEYAAIVYLTPNAPAAAGTAFYRHVDTQYYRYSPYDPVSDLDKINAAWQKSDRPWQDIDPYNDNHAWELIGWVGNVFNRLIIFNGDYYHRSFMSGFGDSIHNGRLFQTFFFNTEQSYYSHEYKAGDWHSLIGT